MLPRKWVALAFYNVASILRQNLSLHRNYLLYPVYHFFTGTATRRINRRSLDLSLPEGLLIRFDFATFNLRTKW